MYAGFNMLFDEVLSEPHLYQQNWESSISVTPPLAASYEHPDKSQAIETYQNMSHYH